jgi:hypothetical protein
MNQPNLKYDHVFVVLRYDAYISDPINATTVLRIFPTESEAIMEAARLNTIKNNYTGENKSFYFVRQGRISKGLLKECPCPETLSSE